MDLIAGACAYKKIPGLFAAPRQSTRFGELKSNKPKIRIYYNKAQEYLNGGKHRVKAWRALYMKSQCKH